MPYDPDAFYWQVRNEIYRWFVEEGRPPTVTQAAEQLNATIELAREAFLWLAEKHAIFLEPGASEPQVRMAFPFSAIPTSFRVQVGIRSYWANCAWDLFGIPAALHTKATLEAECADCGEKLELQVMDGGVSSTNPVAHFLVPFKHWYEDLVHT